MVFSKSLLCALAMGVIPSIFASPVNLNELLTRDGPSPIVVPFKLGFSAYYYVQLLVGSQKTPVSVNWDTGSYVAWVPNSNITCGDGTNRCKYSGTFDPLNSTTFVDLHEHWGGEYLDGGDNYGWWGKDQVSIGNPNGAGASVTDFEFIVVDSSAMQGVFGVALANQPDPNYLPTKLRAQGHITKAAFSYWHDAPDSNSGFFLLGGLDEAKFEGDLVSVPLMKNEGGMKIPVTSIVAGGELFSIPYSAPATIDTGASTLTIPHDALANITTRLGGNPNSYDGTFFYVPCDQGDKTVDFVFGEKNATVSIPASELLGPGCLLEIYSGDYWLLGHPLQKYGYFVFDQDDYSISIAKPTYSSDSKLVNL